MGKRSDETFIDRPIVPGRVVTTAFLSPMEAGNVLEKFARQRGSLLALAFGVAITAAPPTHALDPIEGENLADKARYLCDWRQTHPENPTPLAYCDHDDVPRYMWALRMQDWWQWMFNRYEEKAAPMRGAFLDDWTAHRKPVLDEAARDSREKEAEEASARRDRMAAETAARARADAVKKQKEAADHENWVAHSAPGLTPESLCFELNRGSKAARQELERRNLLNAIEWTLVDSHRIQIGMSETALLCSWGRTDVNRTVTAAGEHKQYVYGRGTMVYVDDGRVTAFQDSR